MAQKSLQIAGRPIGPGHPPYIVAEMSGNHNGDIGRALAIIDAAAEAGADAVKLQTYTADTLTIDHDGPDFRIDIKGSQWEGRTLYDLYREAHTPWDWHPRLFEHGRKRGVAVFSSPFDETAVDFLESLAAPAYKIASFEMIDLPLVERVAATGKPLVMSTGMATFEEIGESMATARAAGCRDLILLHCVSGYPTEPRDANLQTIPHMAKAFEALIGLSDHTRGVAVSVAAIALGACFIEKHLTLRRADGGPDSKHSLEPAEFTELIKGCRSAWEALGRISYEREESERENVFFRRSLYVVADVAKGERFTAKNVRSIRPSRGLAPKYLPDVLGKRAARDLKRGTALQHDMIAD